MSESTTSDARSVSPLAAPTTLDSSDSAPIFANFTAAYLKLGCMLTTSQAVRFSSFAARGRPSCSYPFEFGWSQYP